MDLGSSGRVWACPGGFRSSAGGWSFAETPQDWTERIPWGLAALDSIFIKLGQLASTRTDVLSPQLPAALEQLQDHVAPLPVADVESVRRGAWGTAHAIVRWLDPVAMASASIAQGHGGRLPDGRWPGILVTAPVDREIVERLAAGAAPGSREHAGCRTVSTP